MIVNESGTEIGYTDGYLIFDNELVVVKGYHIDGNAAFSSPMNGQTTGKLEDNGMGSLVLRDRISNSGSVRLSSPHIKSSRKQDLTFSDFMRINGVW